MDALDQFVKHELRVKYYARYTDDFVIVSDDRVYLQSLIPKMSDFLEKKLALSLHPNKVSIRKYRQGIDFLGYVSLPHHTKVRTQTQRRVFRKMKAQVIRFNNGEVNEATLLGSYRSYLGVLSHADAHEVAEEFQNQFLFWMSE